jgi:hypothetical protein
MLALSFLVGEISLRVGGGPGQLICSGIDVNIGDIDGIGLTGK